MLLSCYQKKLILKRQEIKTIFKNVQIFANVPSKRVVCYSLSLTGTKALEDAGLSYDKVEQAAVGYVYGLY